MTYKYVITVDYPERRHIWDWCVEHIGKSAHDTFYYDPGQGQWPNIPKFIIYNPEHATLFKLVWGEYIKGNVKAPCSI